MDATAGAIRKAVAGCEESSGLVLKAVYIGVAGGHIRCQESFGATGIKGREVSSRDIERVMEAAATVYVPLDRELLHVLPSDFIVDGQEGIVKPEGMSGVRLEANVRVITASHAAVENLVKCCETAGLKVMDAILEPIASAKAVLRPYELDTGAVVIDMGGGTTDVAIFNDGTMKHASVLPVGGNNITGDIAIGLKVSMEEAERLKRKYGYAMADEDPSGEMEVAGMDGRRRPMPRKYMGEIIRPRCEEMFALVRQGISDALLYSSPVCVVLTGGTALLGGTDRIAEAAFGLPVRVGVPENGVPVAPQQKLCSPGYSTSVGLMMHGLEAERNAYDDLFDGLFGRLRKWGRNVLAVKKWGFGTRQPS
jgi:cell division protein FtsA